MSIHMAASVVGAVLVAVHDEHTPGDDEWQTWLDLYRKRGADSRALIVHSTGGGPSSPQRKHLLDAINALARVPPVAVLTSSTVMRGLVTAIGWFEPAARRAKTFRLDELAAACTALGLDRAMQNALKVEIDRLRGSLGAHSTRASA
jgi:hypothetical protein